MCAKCGFSCPSSDKATFKSHIQTHNHKQEPQCPECGLCFTVLNAVKRHLFALHKIKNIDEYLAENGMAEEDEEEEEEFDSVLGEMLPGMRPLPLATRHQQAPLVNTDSRISKEQADDDLDSLECNVCYRSFDSEANLKTHMRTHGMAFIRSKRYKPI
ncbi:zinc finger protein 532 [Elysia marginata]|uniref:Zinc finger protein 532 n=1 Tax=Elysia marginata TaxID=1093978 RepID=A0AAV4ELW2_9GAST|nr:zinc finger protein 532 [Elysia marginata]